MRRYLRYLVIATLATACAGKAHRSPERLRDKYVQALSSEDPRAAYDLLAPELQAEIPYADFEARWKSNAKERAEARQRGEKLDGALRPAVLSGTTAHEGGRVLTWTLVGDRYYVVDGFPGAPQTATPGQTIRALITAVRETDLSTVRALLGDDLAASIEEDWTARVEAMEAALDRPGSIELSTDLRRAELSYEQGRVLTLEQTPTGWRITSLE